MIESLISLIIFDDYFFRSVSLTDFTEGKGISDNDDLKYRGVYRDVWLRRRSRLKTHSPFFLNILLVFQFI